MKASRHKALALAISAALIFQSVAPVFAHNERIHQEMTDYAYHLAVAMAEVSGGHHGQRAGGRAIDDPRRGGHARVLQRGGRRRAEAAGAAQRPAEDPAPCIDPDVKALTDDNNDTIPDWQNLFTLGEQSMAFLVYPITPRYANKNITCEIDKNYAPIGSTALVNPVSGATAKEQFRSRDYTGVTLGYWAGGPDRALKDWIYRSTTLETLQSPGVQIGVGAGVSALAFAACAIACGLMPILCAVCPAIAIGAGILVIDAINDIDASSMEHEDFTGLGHHIDMKPLQAGDTVFDDQRGKFMEKAGPAGNPDLLEEAVMALYDLLGWHLRTGPDFSQGPPNYQIFVAGTLDADAHPDSTPRSASQWETETGAHIQYTPIDNLALWGWKEFRAKQSDANAAESALAAPRLGWSLHALGDASVPMHVVGATGYGHRPYEESFDNRWEELVFSDASTPAAMSFSLRQAREIVKRALVWRQFILQWRATNGGTLDVPVRDFITALADQTRTGASGVPGIYNPNASFEWQFGSEDDANGQYSSPSIVNFQRDRAIEAVAASLAMLISGMEVIQ